MWKLAATWPEEQQKALLSWKPVKVGDFIRVRNNRTGEETDAIVRFLYPYTFKAHFTDKAWLDSLRARKTEWEVIEVVDHPEVAPPPEGAQPGEYVEYAVESHIELRFRYKSLKNISTRRRVQPLYTFVARTTGNPILLTRDYYLRGGDFRAFIITNLSEIKLGEPFLLRDKLMYKDVQDGLAKISETYALKHPEESPEEQEESLLSTTLYQGLSEYRDHLAVNIMKASSELDAGYFVKLTTLDGKEHNLQIRGKVYDSDEFGDITYWGYERTPGTKIAVSDLQSHPVYNIRESEIASCELLEFPAEMVSLQEEAESLKVNILKASSVETEKETVERIFGKSVVRTRKISDYPRVYKFLKGLLNDIQDVTIYEMVGQHPCTNLKYIVLDADVEPLRKEHSLAHEYGHVHYKARTEDIPRAIAKKFRGLYGLPDSYLADTLKRYTASIEIPEGYIR